MASAGLAAADGSGCDQIRLAEIAGEAGLGFVHDRGDAGGKHLPETMGAGIAWLDFDGDGWRDLYVVQSGPFPPDGSEAAANRLFRNLGDGGFEEASARSGTADRGCGQGVVAADVDGDGDQDLYLTNYGSDRLLINRGDGAFEDGTKAAGLGLDGWSSSAALADADGDGDLDLFVSRYVEYDPEQPIFCGDRDTGERRYCDPSLFEGASDVFYTNEGNGAFAVSGAAQAAAVGRGLGVLFADLDGDLAPELYVANDLTPNHLLANLGDGAFEDLSLISGAAVNRDGRPEAGMGVALADVDGDGDPDLAVTNFDVETNTLYRNLGALSFDDMSATTGFGLPSFNFLAFGLAALDLDLDADVDFYVANGHIFEQPARKSVTWRQRDQVMLGDGAGGFSACVPETLGDTVARGLAVADFDNDGDPDLAVSENGGPLAILRNDLEGGSWLGVELIGRAPNRDAVGAVVRLAGAGGAQTRWVVAGDSYQSSSDRRPLFGLDDGPGVLEITWRSGAKRRLVAPPAGRYLRVFE